MGANEVRLNDIGTVFEFEIKDGSTVVDVSGQTTMEIFFLKADGTTKITQNAVFSDDGVDGKIRYVTVSGDLDQVGKGWKRQGHVVISSGEWRTDIIDFEVHPNID